MNAQPSVDFSRDIQPILAKHCFSCHGPEKQKSGLRLDRKAEALRGGDSGKVFVPGKPGESLLVQRITEADDSLRMPPKGPALSGEQITLLKRWIEQGAAWPDDTAGGGSPADWWSLKPVRRPELPNVEIPAHGNDIDRFIVAKLNEQKLSLSPMADRRTLIRRLTFDLIGLPPTPEEIDQFVKDPDPQAYAKLVDRLLASPHYGERWARHWLDVVHYGETHGYDKDQPRPHAWPYRDYVIRSFNADKPYRQFVAEQIAGDVLSPNTVDGIEALGFLSAGPWDLIGHAEVPETKRDGMIARHLDRDDFVSTTMSTFLGLTVHCAQCHHHKFDPISQDDYYRLQAVFAAIDRTNVTYDLDPQIAARRKAIQQKRLAASEAVARLEREARTVAGDRLTKIEDELRQQTRKLQRPPEYGYHSAIADNAETVKWVQIDLKEPVQIDRVILKPCHDDFNGIGAGFGFPVRFRIELSDDPDFRKQVTKIEDRTDKDVPNPKLTPHTVTANGTKGRYLRLTATKLARRSNDYNLALAELEAIDDRGVNRAKGITVTALDSIEAPIRWRKSNLTDGLAPSQGSPTADRDALQNRRDELVNEALGPAKSSELAAGIAELAALDIQEKALSGPQRTAYIGAIHTGSGSFTGTGSTGGKPRPIHRLIRGDITKPGPRVEPAPLSGIPGMAATFTLAANATEGEARAALARWIVEPNHPLTWRVMANRVWQYHFGRGLVDTPNDFGRMGQLPSHPELLDFLASDLREHQSLKRLHRLIVLSASYRQSSAVNAEHLARDADNRWLARQNRRKLDAESIRDSMLAISGKLNPALGGPSFKDFVIERPEHSPHYQYHLHDPEDAATHRRSVYRMIVRSKPQPFLAALDCADPSQAVDKRNESTSPQQALALLNNALSLAMSNHLAARLKAEAATDPQRIDRLVHLALGRPPTEAERQLLLDHARKHGLPSACRVVLNLNEFVFVD